MKLIDVHSHVQFNYFDADRDEVTRRALEDLETIINVGADPESSRKAVEQAEQWPVFAAVGFHPEEAEKITGPDLKELKMLAANPKVVAIGEIGLDVKIPLTAATPTEKIEEKEIERSEGNLTKQIDLFENQLLLAEETGKPVILHCRNAYDEMVDIIKNQRFTLKGLVHCWMGSIEQMDSFLKLGLGISFTGNITYPKNDYIREAAKKVPLDRLFVETDCPFMPPQPIRGSRNEPKFVKMVAECIAEVRGVSYETIVEATNRNSKELFNLT